MKSFPLSIRQNNSGAAQGPPFGPVVTATNRFSPNCIWRSFVSLIRSNEVPINQSGDHPFMFFGSGGFCAIGRAA